MAEGTARSAGLTVRFFGASTIALSDGRTTIMTDGFFSRPSFAKVMSAPLEPDVPTIERVLRAARISQVAALFVAHSHHDHVLDAAAVANLTSAIMVGSQSTGNVTGSAGLPEGKFIGIADGTVCRFGDFTVTAFSTPHSMPVLYPGEITDAFRSPASVREYREGGNFTFHIGHPWGNILIVPSLGVRREWRMPLRADVVLLGVGGFSTRAKRRRYWDQFVTGAGATRIYPIHWDNFFKPVRAGPVGKPTWSLRRKLRALSDLELPGQTIGMLPFADEVSLYPASDRRDGKATPLPEGCQPPAATQKGDR